MQLYFRFIEEEIRKFYNMLNEKINAYLLPLKPSKLDMAVFLISPKSPAVLGKPCCVAFANCRPQLSTISLIFGFVKSVVVAIRMISPTKTSTNNIKTLVDIDENLFAERVTTIAKNHGYQPGTAFDMRRVVDDQEIDAVIIATPNHWHALATIWACQAGKHVYVEKPCSHNVWEGRQTVAAARSRLAISLTTKRIGCSRVNIASRTLCRRTCERV